MGVRVGADVGGTFTKAVAIDSATGELAGRAVVPTTHDHPDGVSAGVVDVVAKLVAEVGADAIELVTHSTTQAVNALLEGDTVPVGVIGLGRAPYLRKARKHTMISRAVAHEFLDVSAGLDADTARQALQRLAGAGAQAVCVAEAFAPDDSTCEDAIAALATELGLPVTTSSGLTGLYGLELRTVTAALNASILPIALRTAEVVEAGVAAAGVTSPVMVMRGDGGATDLSGFRSAPARTLYSGPAASVAGALRTLRIGDGVIVEVGGTSTNVAAITAGRPALSYVRVAGQATAVRALDVQVAGVAGGSMLRVRRRRVYGVGPRSAHIAGLPYSCFVSPERLAGAHPEPLAPRPGDPADYLALRLADGTMAALTNTCAANALGLVPDGDYAKGNAKGSQNSAAAAMDIAGAALRLPGAELARRMMQASTEALADLITSVAGQHDLASPTLIAVGGGAGVLGRPLADMLGLRCEVPPGAEVISSMGDALSLVRAERERTVARPTSADIDALIADVETEALAAGAAPASLQVQVSQLGDRGAIRAVAVGALLLGSGVVPGRPPLTREAITDVARAAGCPERVHSVGRFWLSYRPGGDRVLLLDRFGDSVLDVCGDAVVVDGSHDEPVATLVGSLVSRHVRHVGPVTVQPTTWVVQDGRIRELAESVAVAEAVGAGAGAVIVGRN
ncbi:MAG TPA: hydantoinase/oxoprolinase family protein [Pseudonocardiaceae bacterium]|jgi:N-methylhydantoinase A/oxoprolinase/acetone carboxylase beta subunit